jgi:hypothetical protein
MAQAARRPLRAVCRAVSKSDGSFRLAALPGPGYLVVLGPGDDYVLRQENSDRLIHERGTAGGRRFYTHAFITCDPKVTDQSLEVNVTLRRGMAVTGQVVGPDGQPVHDAWMISRIFREPSPLSWLVWHRVHRGSVTSGRFKIHGLDPEAKILVYFREAETDMHRTSADLFRRRNVCIMN